MDWKIRSGVGQRILITSSAGGVGSLAVQLARAAGAHVTAMASAPNEQFVRGTRCRRIYRLYGAAV